MKADVLHTHHISYAKHWTVATMRQNTWDLTVRIMQAYGECMLKGMTKTPTKTSTPVTHSLSVGQPAQPLRHAIVKELEKKELRMPIFQSMLGSHSDVAVDYLNGVLKKIIMLELTIAEAIEIMKKFKSQRNAQAWIVALSSPVVDAGEQKYEVEYEEKTAQTAYMAIKDDLTKLENIPKSHYAGALLDVIYDFDTEESEHALSDADLIKLIDAFAALTTSPD
ncbi:hypothetical protein CYMTET_39045 [Cymbomonas tetramitiformis]|uniref:Uncharacterized protein n=1 Tax=Cymbomonas tetramitiformis TaxID=36881 RepID=A0AAE0F4N1_9CHLO|nr:hypothetical protein CYMTET_39045 [Cymbomonas tetramitiformis]